MSELEPKPMDTAADLKMKIEKKQAELEISKGKKLPEGKTPEPKVIDEKSIEKPQPESKVEKTEEPQPLNGAASEVNPVEWARKKGLNSEEAIARSLREMEQEFHKRNQGKWKDEVPQGTNPPPPPQYEPPRWQPQPAPYLPKQNLQGLADAYKIPAEDIERMLPFVMDAIALREKPLRDELQVIKKETARNAEFRSLMQNPEFTKPEVQMELRKVLEEQPEAFERESEPFSWAYTQAMNRIARRYLQGDINTKPIQSTPYPTRPPVTAGNLGIGTGERDSTEGRMTPEKFASLSVDEQRAYLNRAGLVTSKY